MKPRLILILTVSALALAAPLRSQDLVADALASFPRETFRLEYSSPAGLRTLPNYESLHQRYLGPRLKTLETSLSQLGVKEGDIDEVVLGWKSGKDVMDLYGIAAGRFDANSVAAAAKARGLAPTVAAGQQVYCLGGGETADVCVAVISPSRGAFGLLPVLSAMLEARSGQGESLRSNERFAKFAGEARADAPIWGVAMGTAVPDWFKSWIPGQENLQLNWSQTFQAVEALAYSVKVSDKVHLDVKMDCSSPESASTLRQMLEGVRVFQQMAWQNQNQNRPNPFDSLEVGVHDRRINLSLDTPLAGLPGSSSPGTP